MRIDFGDHDKTCGVVANMNRLSPDIIMKICTDYLNSIDIIRLFRTSKYMYSIWASSNIRIVRNSKQFDEALRDPLCTTALILSEWVASNQYTTDEHIPEKSFLIIGSRYNAIALKYKSKRRLNLSLSYVNPYILKLECPMWNVYMNDCIYASMSNITAHSVHIQNCILPIGHKNTYTMKATKSIIIDNMNFRLDYRDTDSVYWYFTSPVLRINKYKGLWSYASIKCPDTIIENSYLEYEDMSFLNMDTADKDNITVLNTTFKSYFGSSGGHNYVLFVNGHTTVKFDNNTLLTKDGCVITEPSQMVIVR